MSWSITATDTPEELVVKLQDYGDRLMGQSKVEFDEALPALIVLIRQNFADPTQTVYPTPRITLSASGSGHAANGAQVNRCLSCSIKPV